MSFVSAIGGTNFLSVVTDGRVTYEEKVLQEDYQKFRMIGDDIVVAFAGHRAAAEGIFNMLIQERVMKQDFFITASDVKNELNNNPIFKGYKLMWLLGGINRKGQIEFVTVSTEEDGPKQFIPEESDSKLMTYYIFNLRDQTIISPEKLNEKFLYFLEREDWNVGNAQRRLNNYVAKLDYSVNKNVYQALIEK
ncbi:hypothetical protein ACQVQY_13695 [Bacillus mycoides]|uniref:hypothetical protein n=1 Tax=Bacillus mycoides TaxID=1405 RepID=UPI003D64BDCC